MTDGSPPIRVVLCDDVAELRRILREVLEESGNIEVVDEAGTGRECVRIASERHPDVVLLDLSMPDMDGLEALPLIAKASPRTRIIVFSGFAAERMREPALELGADLYIEKGTELDLLAAAVQELARGSRASRASGRAGGAADGSGGPGARGRPPRRTPWNLVLALGGPRLAERYLRQDRRAAPRGARHCELPLERRDPIGESR
jgi:CheY-like chemotaxis protein